MQCGTRRLGLRPIVILATVVATTLIPVTVAGASTPSAPQGVHASEVAGSVEVHWSPPASNGGSSVRRYVATAHPTNEKCVTTTTSCVVAHLTLGASYSFTVVAENAAGPGTPSAPSSRFRVPSAKATFLSAVTSLNVALAADQQAINAATTTPQLSAGLAKYKHAYDSFASALSHATWPGATRGAVARLESDVETLANDTVNAYEASASTAATLFDTLQVDDNKEVEVDATVRSALGLPPLITGPIDVTTPPAPSPLGTTSTVHDFLGDSLSVAVTGVIDPATAGAGSGLADAGFRFVAVEVTLADPGGGEIEGDANFSTTVFGSDGQTYSADFGTTSECTNFVYGLFTLLGNDTSTGCVLFQLPDAVTVQSIDFSLASNYLDTVAWEN